MHRCGSNFLLTSAIAFVYVLALTGCLGKSSGSSANEGVKTVTLNPSVTASMDVGSTLVFSATGKNAAGTTVLGLNIQFVVVSGTPDAPAPISIVNNGSGSGNACAGSWDASGAICSPGTPGIAIVTAVVNGYSSAITTVYVHQHIDSIEISPIVPQGPPQQQYDCFSQGQSWDYQAIAYSSIAGQNVDITSSVGPMTWSSTNNGVVTTAPYVPTNQKNVQNEVQVTAKTPGMTEIFASNTGVTSNLYPFTTCLVKAIYLQIGGQNENPNWIDINTGGSVPVTAIAVDTLCGIANSTPLTNLPLTWSTTNPEVIAFGSTTSSATSNTASARNNVGGATLTVSCTPPTCNIGLPGLTPSGQLVPSLPIYTSNYQAISNPPAGTCQLPNMTHGYGTISVDVTPKTTATPPTYTAWAATTGCADAPGCNSALFPVTPTTSGTNQIGTILSLPRTPNSMIFNHVSSPTLYIGSDQGLMYVNIGKLSVNWVSSVSTSCNVALCGKVLTISNDGKLVVVSDTVSTPSQVYIYNGANASVAPVDLILSNPGETATAAAFSPDQLKLFILTNLGNMYVYSTVDTFTLIAPLTSGSTTFTTPANAVTPSMDGTFAYVAVSPVPVPPNTSPVAPGYVSGFANCDTPATQILNDVPITSPAINANPLALYTLPNLRLDSNGNPTEVVLALDTPLVPVNATTQQPPTTIDMFGVNVTQYPLLYDYFTCIPPSVTLDTNFPQTSVNLGQNNFTPLYSQLVADGTEMIIVGQNIPAVLVFNVSTGQTSSIQLARPNFGSSYPLSASASTDGSQVFVAACDQYANNDPTNACLEASVHIVSTTGQGDYQQVPYVNINDANDTNMCNNGGVSATQCFPNLIAIKPQ
jgi:hypothetical protein